MTARDYYTAHKADVSGTSEAQVEQALRIGSTRGESQRQADAILLKATSLGEAVAAARAITNPEVRDETEQRVRADFTERQNDLTQRRAALMQHATNLIEQTKSFDAVPPGLISQLSIEERKSLRDYATTLAKGEPVITNWQTFYDLQQKAAADRVTFLQTDLLRYRSQLGDTEFKQLSDFQASLRRGDQSAEDKLLRATQRAEIVRDALGSAGIDPTPKPGDEAGTVAQFHRLVDQNVAQIETATQKPATNEDVQSIVDNLLVQHMTGWLQRNGRRVFQMQPGDEAALVIGDVPRAERLKIADALHTRGLAATDARVLELYRAKLVRMRGVR